MRAAALVLAVTLSGCGSTVQVRGEQQLGGAADGVGQGGTAVVAPDGRGGSVRGPAAVGGTPAGGAAGTGTGAAGPSTGASPVATVPVGETGGARSSGPGYTAREIRVGFSISSDAGRALGGLGLGVQIADQKQLVRTWVTKVNDEGGIAGRKVVPVFFDYSSTGNITTQDQAACATWTQDTRVFAATGVRAGASGRGDVLTACLAKAGVPWLAATGDAHKWARYLPAMYSTADLNRTREERVLVESLAAQGFFTPKSKIGVIINDGQADMSGAVREGMEPALQRLGLRIERRIVIANAQTESNNAELQMFAAGVTHVLFAAPGGAAASQFMLAADSQQRTYEYGISTQDAPGLTVQALAPRRQLEHARGYGYRPGLDVDGANQPADTRAMAACFGYFRSKGYDTGSLNRAAMALVCDSLTLLRQALAGQANPTQGGMAQAVAGLGTRVPVASTFSSAFSATKHDGVGTYRFLRYEARCSCFRYQGPLRPVS